MSLIKLSVVFFLFGFVTFTAQNEAVPKVDTALGTISGYYKTTQHGKKYEAYEGIPYAEPPLGELRFEPSKPVRKWEHELPARKKGSICTQYRMVAGENGDRVAGCEDCLYMNIYATIRNSSETKLPVMFWIHGGAFQYGSGNELDEERLMDRNIILVTFNYRVGPFGFLSTGDSVVPGNMGLKDQSLALRWVNDNIESFGGNSNEITIFGLSAGGVSVHYHYLSPLSAGLFQRGISISGVALNPRALTRRAPEKAKKLGAVLGCPTNVTADTIACLKNRPPRSISEAVSNFMYWLYNPATPFGPVVEKEGSTPFINRSPHEIMTTGPVQDVPWITGVVSEEGLFPTREFVCNDDLLNQLNDKWDDIAPYLFNYNDTIPLDQQKQVAKKIRKYYIGLYAISSDTVIDLIHMIGDRSYRVGLDKAVKLQANLNRNPVYCYYYTYEAVYNFMELETGCRKRFGVGHGDDANLVINNHTANLTNPEDIKMQKFLIDLYTSFAIEGRPRVNNVEWQPQVPDSTNLYYLRISNPKKISMKHRGNFGENDFWNAINFDEN